MLRDAERRLEAEGVEAPRFEAQLLLALALGVTRTSVVAGTHGDPTPRQIEAFEQMVRQREQRVPLAYLRGTQEFYGLTFAVGPAVLIPRPETEMLVEFALEALEAEAAPSELGGGGSRDPIVLADVGTGSGCILVAALAHRPDVRGVGIDVSAGALEIARRNAFTNNVGASARFVRAGMLACAPAACFDVIVSNPPYIPSAEIETLQPEVRDYEPRLALDGGEDGLAFQRELAHGAMRTLKPDGRLAVELAMGQAPRVAALFVEAGLTDVEPRRDLAGIERIVSGRRPTRA